MTQTLAIFLDAYRSLNSKRLFWIVLALSGVLVAAFACLGINEQGVKILFWQRNDSFLNTRNFPPEIFYKRMFSELGIKVWLSSVATILALVSTAGIFPDLLTQGSIDMYIARPISRWRLFVVEYLAGLMFVTLQVFVFIITSFVVLGIRGGVWEPSMFWAVPIVVCFFSYLFSVCVFLGVWTRSTMASLLLTILFWVCLIGLDWSEQGLLLVTYSQQQDVASRLGQPSPEEGGPHSSSQQGDSHGESNDKAGPFSWGMLHRCLYGLKTVLPKTGETMYLLDRQLLPATQTRPHPKGSQGSRPPNAPSKEMLAGAALADSDLRNRPVSWVIGTSLGFEFVVLAVTAVIFCRRDY